MKNTRKAVTLEPMLSNPGRIDKNLHERFVECGRQAKEWTRKCALLLPEIDRRAIWSKKGFSSIYEYAAKIAGMNRNSVDDAMRILKKIEDKPALQKVVEQKGLNAVRPVATIATGETQEFWARKAMKMSKNTLRVYVREFRSMNGASPEAQSAKRTVLMELDVNIANEMEKLKGERSWEALMREFLEMHKEELKNEKPEAVETNSRHIPAKIKRYVINRTHGRCAYPGCLKPYTILHHTQRFANEQVHDPDRLIPLCKAHEQIAHHGLIDHEEKSSEYWRLRREADRSNPKYCIDQLVEKHRSRPYCREI